MSTTTTNRGSRANNRTGRTGRKSAAQAAQVSDIVTATSEKVAENNLLGLNSSSHDLAVLTAAGGSVYDIELIDSLLNAAPVESENIEDSALYKKVKSHFTVVPFDESAKRLELINGVIARTGSTTISDIVMSNIDAKVAELKKEYNKNNVAPVCSVAIVLELIKKEYAQEYKEYTGTDINTLSVSSVRYYSRVFGSLSSSVLSSTATSAEIIRAILSEKIKKECAQVIENEKKNARKKCYSGIDAAAVGAFKYGMSLEKFLDLAKRYYLIASHMTTKLEKGLSRAQDKNAALAARLRTIAFSGAIYLTDIDSSGDFVLSIPNKAPKKGAKVVTDLVKEYNNRAKQIAQALDLLSNK